MGHVSLKKNFRRLREMLEAKQGAHFAYCPVPTARTTPITRGKTGHHLGHLVALPELRSAEQHPAMGAAYELGPLVARAAQHPRGRWGGRGLRKLLVGRG